MTSSESVGMLGPLSAIVEANGDAIEPSEHELSIRIARALHTIDAFERHVDPHYREAMPVDQATFVRIAVEETYHSYLRPLEDPHDYDDYGHGRPYERETDAIERALRNIWHQNYYERRSHPTVSDEFQTWLDAYVEKYGMEAVAKTTRSGSPFERVYRTFEFARGNDTDLRTAERDILLIQGCGSRAVATLEVPDTKVQEAIPGVNSHNRIFSSDISPEQRFDQIIVPGDIKRSLGSFAARSSK
jgi:hypothetical protein